ncbi:alpha-1 2-mannosidase [Bacteroidia bacterium]|nr:alpha-1 2-mannosidase [Bacteroidia bacterium]
MKKFLLLSVILGLIWGCNPQKSDEIQVDEDYCKYINPFIGNADNGHTFPGATVPFGFIQVSPETGNDSWRYCSGYNYEDKKVLGFAQNHLNGTGCSDLGDVLILPFSGEALPDSLRAAIDKSTEKASPGYYYVQLPDYKIDVELTATQRTAFHKYTFHQDKPANIFLDMQSGVVWSREAIQKHVLSAEMNMVDNQTITGHQEVRNWVRRHYYYVIKFDKPYSVKEELPLREGEKAKRLVLGFDLKPGEPVQVKVSISSVSIDGAIKSMETENPDWNFAGIKEKAHSQWNDLLAKAQVTGTEDQKTAFYTSMYHLLIQPNNIADTDGSYRGVNDSVLTSKTGNYYSTLSLWDTYRAAHPLYTIIIPEKVDDIIQTMIAHQKIQGFLPIWALWGKENYCMIANHAVPVVVDAYLKGFKGFDAEEAYQAVKTSLTVNHLNSDWDTYMKYGYYPFDIIKSESVSRTLESVYDDYCAAQMAKALGKTEDYEYFKKRSGFYKNLFDPETKLMRGKDSKGNWRTPFNPFQLAHSSSIGGDFTEGNSWQYTWHVQHDPQGLIDLMGGKDIFAQKLDSLFFLEADTGKTGFVSDVSGLIGQYAHGNEPSHHVAYLYNYAGRPWKTQELIREIFDRFYLNKPDGLCGNDDCGQMSAWYIFSAMGFYPVNPIGGEYVIGAPQIEKVSLSLPEGKTFLMEAKGLSKENKYVKSVTLNGLRIDNYIINHKDIMNGGHLVFTMTNEVRNQ